MQKNISSIVLYIISAISVILALLFFFGPEVSEFGEDVPKFYSLNITWAAILFVGTVALTLIFAIVYIITHPKALKNAVIGVVALGILVLISYLLASDAKIPDMEEDVTAGTLKWVGTGIYITYILGGLAIVSIIVSEIYRAIR